MGKSATRITPVRQQGIDCVRLGIEGASVTVSRFGAQVLSWVPADGKERLFLSERAVVDGTSPIRGGVPICFPQFSGLGSLPKHGFARIREWQTTDAADTNADLVFSLESDQQTRSLWPHAFAARFAISLSALGLTMQFSVRNTGDAAFAFTGALHSYFRIAAIEHVALSGLGGCEYRDAADADAVRRESNAAIRFEAEVDRVYHDAPRELVLKTPEGALSIASDGFADTVVWNPGATLCARMPDMAPDGYRYMVCVEAAAARLPVRVLPGQSWTGRQTLTVIPLERSVR
jgi:glucose-6-phosphate 1-epimerase